MRNSRPNDRTRSAALAACLAGAAGAALAQPFLPAETLHVGFAGELPQDFAIPWFYGATLEFTLEGANGGGAERRALGNRVDYERGGNGATLWYRAVIGDGAGELTPGGQLRFIIGEAGEEAGTNSGGTAFFPARAGGGGGGGTGLLYLRAGQGNWHSSSIVAAAGGGGGGFVVGGGSSQGGPGGDGTHSECGGNPVYGCNGNQVGGCGGQAGITDAAFGTGNFAGAGASGSGGFTGAGAMGFPDGGRGGFDGNGTFPNDSDGGWGFGGGGMGVGWSVTNGTGWDGTPGGGGGYSGGGTFKASEHDNPANNACAGGAGGGGSFVSDLFGTGGFVVASTSGHGEGSVTPMIPNDEAAGAVPLVEGSPAGAAFDLATATGLDYCGTAAVEADLWYTYTNDTGCGVTLTVSPRPVDALSGVALDPSTVGFRSYTGAAPSGTDCRASGVGSYVDDVMPGETVSISAFSMAGAGVAALLDVTTDVITSPNANFAGFVTVGAGEPIGVTYCATEPAQAIFLACDGAPAIGHVLYYAFVNDQPCPVDATITMTSGSDHTATATRVGFCGDFAAAPQTVTLHPSDLVILQITSPTASPASFIVETTETQGLPDCDGDGIPDACDPDGPCLPPANDDMANAFPVTLGAAAYDTVRATPDGSSSCDAQSGDADVWFTYTAGVDGQLIVWTESDLGAGALGQVGLSVFSADGAVEFGCDLGAEADRISASASAASFVPVLEGQTVLIRVSVPQGAMGGLATGLLQVGLDSALTNDVCATARDVSLAGDGSAATLFFPTYAQNEGDSGFCFTAAADHYDTWYTFTAPANGTVTFALRYGVAPLEGGLELYDACGGAVLACDGGATPTLTYDIGQGESVTLRALHTDAAFSLTSHNILTTFEGDPSCGSADLNADGLLDLSDINLFTSGFLAQDPIADLDGSGVFDLTDINLFTSAFVAGCP